MEYICVRLGASSATWSPFTGTLIFVVAAFPFSLVFPSLDNVPVVDTRSSDLHCLLSLSASIYSQAGDFQFKREKEREIRKPTVICSRKNSRSSSQFFKLSSAAASFSLSIVSASANGYASITFAPNHR